MPDPRDTPAMRQFYAFKAKHPDCVLLFRMGDFYETFDDDAVRLSKALGLTLTQRTEGVPMAGVPYHQLENYLRRAVAAGFRVAVAEQVQDPKDAKGVVARAVTQVLTPGTLLDEGLVSDDAPVRLAAVTFVESGDEGRAGVAVAELGTGAFSVFDAPAEAVGEELARLGVNEVLYAEAGPRSDGAGPPLRVRRVLESARAPGTPRPGWHFRREEALEAIRSHYRVSSPAGFGLGDDEPCIGAIGAVLRYLGETQLAAREEARSAGAPPGLAAMAGASLAHLRPPRREDASGVCVIDSVSLRALEIERTMRGGGVEGSLLGLFVQGRTRCRTPMGKRLIREWLKRPLARAEDIDARQRRVATLVEDPRTGAALGDALERVQDVPRIGARVMLGRASPRDLVALGRSLGAWEGITSALEGATAFESHLAGLREAAEEFAPLCEAIMSRCVDAPPAHLREGGLIRDGVDAALDEMRLLQRDAGAWLAEYQARLIAEFDLPSLKVGFNSVFGYYIELPAAQARRAPDRLTRKQTLKNAERYITPELKDFEDRVTSAQARAVEREQAIFRDLCAMGAGAIGAMLTFAELASELDATLTFAEKARERSWTRPEIVAGARLEIVAGRHPVLDESLPGAFVPNDTLLGGEGPSLVLITGPNMAGKSTYIRQSALIAALALAGSYVPADRASVGACDRIFTRVGADDALHQGQSTFMVEMTETANILNHAGPRSLVILDEIGRGTSTLDGLSLAWAIAERLAALRCRALFATHYHELTRLEDDLPGRVHNLNVRVRELGDEVVFLHHIEPGRTDRSYGIQVARLAGVPREVVERARAILASLSVEQERRSPGRGRGAPAGDAQLALFKEYLPHPAVGVLKEMKIESTSPLEAFETLRRLVELANREP
ncbi:MAG: DNA mismatch repair protein MutS [Phycisphaerales bacterium]|nr:DNA mismatch repair protein MutS [Phycisphaerales bacterium]